MHSISKENMLDVDCKPIGIPNENIFNDFRRYEV